MNQHKACLTIAVDIHDLVEAVKAHKFNGVTREWEPDLCRWTYEAHFEMPPRIGGYEIDDYKPEVEDLVAEYLIAEWQEAAA